VAARAGDARRRRADGAARGRGKKIRVSKSENIINDIKILKIKTQIENVLCHPWLWNRLDQLVGCYVTRGVHYVCHGYKHICGVHVFYTPRMYS
jgi:hypothetical protein